MGLLEQIFKTTDILVPTSSSSTYVAPVPTIISSTSGIIPPIPVPVPTSVSTSTGSSVAGVPSVISSITSSLFVSTSTLTSTMSYPPTTVPTSVAPIPTVAPDVPVFEKLGSTGVETLYVVFAFMIISALAFAILAWRTPIEKRLFHIITTFIVLFAAIAYLGMAMGGGRGWTVYHEVEHHKHGVPDTQQRVFRQVLWGRYFDWALTTPLLLLDLALLAGLAGADILVTIVADEIMILTGLFGALAHGKATWVWYTVSIIAFLFVIFQLGWNGLRTARTRDRESSTWYMALAGWTAVVWVFYPIIFALSEGAHIIGVDAETIAYGVLDILAKPVFGAVLLFIHDRKPSTNVILDGVWSNGFGHEGRIRVGEDEEGA